jgi:hypothetical protein
MQTKQEEFRLAESKLLEGIRSLEMQIQEQRTILYKLRADHSESLCPLKIGEVLEHTGYSHTGKMVRVVQYIPASGNYDRKTSQFANWTTIATVLKKDGSESTYTVEIHGYTEPQD